jgi:hypothetical protein
VKKAPAHAGSLSPWERLAFALAFALMAAFVVVVTVSAARAHQGGARPAGSATRGGQGSSGSGSPALPGSQPDRSAHGAGAPAGGTRGTGSSSQQLPAGSQPAFAADADRALATALAPVLRQHTGNLAIGVIDRSTGATAIYNGRHRFHTASIVKADILATVLLQHQQAGALLTAAENGLAIQMIEHSDNDAASDLWNDIGGGDSVADANRLLGLRRTTSGPGGYWGLTSTTVRDQLRLLTDLVSSRSPLNAASRAYELGLMRQVEADQDWGVTAAAAPGSSPAVKNGWLPDPVLWVINSIGVIRSQHQQLLVAVLSDDQPTEAAGIAQDQAAAVAAVSAVTSGRA